MASFVPCLSAENPAKVLGFVLSGGCFVWGNLTNKDKNYQKNLNLFGKKAIFVSQLKKCIFQ
jgi:hypothetical protein